MDNNYSLFSTKAGEAGFRLQFMEVYNWGVFDKKVWKISPSGNNSLLTGSNASGKTSFIDALLTLLVPFKKDRFYNQSSGVKNKGDRDEESYVLGHYGDIQNEGDLSTTTQMLRNRKDYSVLLASFSNTEQKTVTLFQCRWFANEELKRSFGIAHVPLSIESAFFPFDQKGKWKNRLDAIHNVEGRRRNIEYFNGPGDYADRLTRLFGMRSLKALSLFNQIVGIKVLGNLDEFIRLHMLEEKDAEKEYKELNTSFINLMDAQNSIEKAQKQIDQLTPINENSKQLFKNKNELKELEEVRDLAVVWFAERGVEVCKIELNKIESFKKQLLKEIKVLENENIELDEMKSNLQSDISNSETGRQIQGLEIRINKASEDRDKRNSFLKNYNLLVEKLGFPTNPNASMFQENQKKAKEEKAKFDSIKLENEERKRHLINQSEEVREKIENGKEYVETLKSNNNNIPNSVARIREQILENVGATKNEIPFIGELIKINEDQQKWEPSIERVLHSFALRLIVPDKFYHKVNMYVNRTNLKGRIIYEIPKKTNSLLSLKNEDDKRMVNKITFKPDSIYKDWLQEQILNRYNFYCANDLKDFQNAEKAMTLQGLVKHSGGRHEKDDRQKVYGRQNYILGWDNTEKITWWHKQIKEWQHIEITLNAQIKKVEFDRTASETKSENYIELYKKYEDFDEIDWSTYAIKVQDLQARKEKIEKSDNKLKTLKAQLFSLKEKQNNLNQKIKEKSKMDWGYDIQIKEISKQAEGHQSLLNNLQNKFSSAENFNDRFINFPIITYDNFDDQRNTFQKNTKDSIDNLVNKNHELEKILLTQMNRFINPSEETVKIFPSWRSDVSYLSIDLDLVEEYQDLFNNLVKDGLPQFREKFNDHLEDTILRKVHYYKEFFNSWKNEIETNIEALNDALEEIDYKSYPRQSFIQLDIKNRNSGSLNEFKSLLRNATPNLRQWDDSLEGKSSHFENNIKPLIEKLKDERWRHAVTDVRNWFEFKTDEFIKSTWKITKTYEAMGQLSGGEKAQLTYTVLSSAIAYQFGLTNEGLQSNSFRFIAIDEAFKAQDAERAEFLMRLCKQLHLQLLVVTPSNNIEIVEDHISYVHLIERKDERDSAIYNMTIEQFKEQEALYKAAL